MNLEQRSKLLLQTNAWSAYSEAKLNKNTCCIRAFRAPGNLNLRVSLSLLDLDFCKAGQLRSPDYHTHQQQQQQPAQHQEEALCTGPAARVHGRGYSLGVGSDVDTEPEVDPSPAHGLQHMWMRGLKSEQSSCLTSRANSALSLTDTEHDRKSEPDNGE